MKHLGITYKTILLSIIFFIGSGVMDSTSSFKDDKVIPTFVSANADKKTIEKEMCFDAPVQTSSTSIPGNKIVVVVSAPSLSYSGFRSISVSLLQKIAYSKKKLSFSFYHSNLKLKTIHFNPIIKQLLI